MNFKVSVGPAVPVAGKVSVHVMEEGKSVSCTLSWDNRYNYVWPCITTHDDNVGVTWNSISLL